MHNNFLFPYLCKFSELAPPHVSLILPLPANADKPCTLLAMQFPETYAGLLLAMFILLCYVHCAYQS